MFYALYYLHDTNAWRELITNYSWKANWCKQRELLCGHTQAQINSRLFYCSRGLGAVNRDNLTCEQGDLGRCHCCHFQDSRCPGGASRDTGRVSRHPIAPRRHCLGMHSREATCPGILLSWCCSPGSSASRKITHSIGKHLKLFPVRILNFLWNSVWKF